MSETMALQDVLTQDSMHRALDAARNGIVIADALAPDYPVVYANPGFCAMTGYTLDEVLGRNCRFLQDEHTDPEAVATIRAALDAGDECKVVLRNVRKDGSAFWNELTLSPVRDPEGRVVQVIGVQDDVTDRRVAEEQLRHAAEHDALTGALTRAAFAAELDAALLDGGPVSVLYLDLDGFKAVNDTLGHYAGDEVLAEVVRRLESGLRPGDLVGRQGGDELVVLVRAGADGAALVTERLRERLELPVLTAGAQVVPRASFGTAVAPRDATTAAGLLRAADNAMYAAKRGAEPDATAVEVASVQDAAPASGGGALRRLLGGTEVRSVYQPIVELGTGRTVAFEALARGPQGTELERPDLLFAAARAAGLEPELDWACRTAAVEGAVAAGMPTGLRLFVNVEPSSLGTACPDALLERWERASSELDLVLEITERALTARPADLLRLADRARLRGWAIALDDVGADVRSLALMPLLRPDVIKLDLRLVQEQPSMEVAAIVNAVAAHRERTGAIVLAEGIEHDGHVAIAHALGASHGQGWHFGRPGALVAPQEAGELVLPRRAAPLPGVTPFEVVARRLPIRRATKPLLLAISHTLEDQGRRQESGGVVLGAFQTVERFTPKTIERYTAMARDAALVGAFGIGLPVTPAPGVRGATIAEDDALKDEWSVAVLGPHFAAALVAVDLGDDGPDRERRFDFALTYDRDLVVEAANALVARIVPATSPLP